MSLSKEKRIHKEVNKGFYWEEDVKEAVKKLKEELNKKSGSWVNLTYGNVLLIINKIFGEELTK